MLNRRKLTAFLESPMATVTIMIVIIVNAIVLGLETSSRAMGFMGPIIVLIDEICLGIFVIEIILKLIAYRLKFFRNGWNFFDFIVVL